MLNDARAARPGHRTATEVKDAVHSTGGKMTTDNLPVWAKPKHVTEAELSMLKVADHVEFAQANPWYGVKLNSLYEAFVRMKDAIAGGEVPEPRDMENGPFYQVALMFPPELAIKKFKDLAKPKSATRKGKDPAERPFYDAFMESLTVDFEDYTYANVRRLVGECESGTIPNVGVPQVIYDLARKVDTAIATECEDTDEARAAHATAVNVAVNNLWFGIAHMGGSHTKLLTTDVEWREHAAVDASGVVLVKDKKTGGPKIVRVAYGIRADGNRGKTTRKSKKKADPAPVDSMPAPEATAPVPGE